MTREEAYNIDILTRTGFNTRIVVDKIYNDFESRTCENCEHGHYTDKQNDDIWCLRENSPVYDCNVEIGFGCNKFEGKTDDK